MGVSDAVGAPAGPEAPPVEAPMTFATRKWVRPEDLNAHGTLFGGSLLGWIDDEAVVYSTLQLGVTHVVTRYMSEISFISSASLGDIVEIGLAAVQFGRTSITMRAEVRNVNTERSVLTIDRIVFISLDDDGVPLAHGQTGATASRDRLRPRGGPRGPGAPRADAARRRSASRGG